MKLTIYGLVNPLVLISSILMLGQFSPQMHPAWAPNQTPSQPGTPDLPYSLYLPAVSSGSDDSWPMAGANPERTSWTSEEVSGQLRPIWYKKFEPYISPKIQIITAYDTIYVSTASGLYALNAQTGAEKWIYPTEMPLGNSPTVYNGMVFVGGLDRKIYALNAFTGQALWKFEAQAGFDTNPLVAEGKVIAGNRDGNLYAIYATGQSAGQLAWKYSTGGPIGFSAAYKDGVVYFASNDSYAYAVDAGSGLLKWRSDKLPGAGFQAWWPVVYRDWVIFAGSENYRVNIDLGIDLLTTTELHEINPHYATDARGTVLGVLGSQAGDWAPNTPTIDMSKPAVTPNGSTVPVTEYFENKPWRRTYLVLNRNTGAEYKTDFDGDGKPEYAPILWLGTHSGNRFPPVVGSDGVLYQSNIYLSDQWISGGQITGWKIGSPYISIVSSDWNAADEPQAYSAGGHMIYWNLCCDRESGLFNIARPNTLFAQRYNAGVRPATDAFDNSREWKSIDYNLDQLMPGYNSLYYNGTNSGVFAAFGGRNGVYGYHGLQNPPIPYKGKLYMHRSNVVMAFGSYSGTPASLPMARIVKVTNSDITVPTPDQLKERLKDEVQKMVTAGHLRPGYFSTGIFDHFSGKWCGDDLLDYWHNPGDTLYTLIRALPYLPADLQGQVKIYLQNEFNKYPPYQYNHIGWKDGAAREPFLLPPEFDQKRPNLPARGTNYEYAGWSRAPHAFYALWMYAEVFGGARQIFDASKSSLEAVPSNSYLAEMPQVHNAYIAGYFGYLQLEKAAGYPETSSVRQTYDRLLSLRAQTFSKDVPASWFQSWDKNYCRPMNVSRNFMYLVPEEAQYLHDNALSKVQTALDEYTYVAPYWFEAKPETAFAEGAINHFYDYSTIFQAKAMILQQPFTELYKYLDVPATQVGDLFYIQNLVTLIEAQAR